MVNCNTVRCHLDGLGHTGFPVILCLLQHAGNQVDIDLLETHLAGVLIRAVNFPTAMGAAVDLKDVIVEILHAQAQTRHADLVQRLQFLIRQRARLALEGHLLHLVPGQQRFHAVREMKQLAAGKVTRRAATEINEARLAFADKRLVRINRQLLQHRVEIAFDGVRILVRVHAEITKVATLPAKRNVRVHPQRRVRSRSPLHGGLNFRHGFFLPKRKRRVVGDKIIADRGLGF